ncbi:MAG: hypothetical protein CMF43_02200 [Legionellales bacterium]|nr:hypothetical protein [Legionellales bacterium]|tara:strand:- start:438 stop:998 length:561 start_codon:yes stop_codon:yes gene_type:complete
MSKHIKTIGSTIALACLLTACGPVDDEDDMSTSNTQGVVAAMAKSNGLKSDHEPTTIAFKSDTKQPATSKDSAWLPSQQDQYTVLFDLNSNGLNEAYKGELVAFAQYLNKHPNQKVHVDGFTCELGSAEYNVALGQRRAYAISKFLESKGVASRQIILVSYGKERPADPAHNELAYTKNRRVEVFF